MLCNRALAGYPIAVRQERGDGGSGEDKRIEARLDPSIETSLGPALCAVVLRGTGAGDAIARARSRKTE